MTYIYHTLYESYYSQLYILISSSIDLSLSFLYRVNWFSCYYITFQEINATLKGEWSESRVKSSGRVDKERERVNEMLNRGKSKIRTRIMLMCESMWFVLCSLFLYICFVPRPHPHVGHLPLFFFDKLLFLLSNV